MANYLNPLADNFTLGRFVLGLVLGAGPPILGALAVGSPVALTPLVRTLGLAPELGVWLLLGLAFTAGGAAVGGLFASKSFVWALLLGYLPIRLLDPTGSVGLVLVLWMGAVAERVSQFLQRRALLV